MPEPSPSAFPQVPKVTDGRLVDAGYYTFNVISRLREDGLPSVASSVPQQQPTTTATSGRSAGSAEHQWPLAGGQSLSGAPNRTAAHNDEEMDPELLAVIKQSILDFKASLKRPPPEPSSGGVMLKVKDMTNKSSSSGIVNRRFPPCATMLDVFRWLFTANSVWDESNVALGSMATVALAGTFPNRLWVCENGMRVLYYEGAVGGIPKSGGSDATNSTVSQYFPSGAESLKLTFAE